MLLPGAILDPGSHWSYQAGYSSCDMDVWHYTVGANSIALCRDNGLVAFLIRDEGIYQFSPSDALNFTQCEWNRVATATEVESLDGSISPLQLQHLQYLTIWKQVQHGIPAVFYDGPRMPIGNGYRGVTNHRALVHQACDQHSDGFDRSVWDFVMSGPPAKKRRRQSMVSFLVLEGFTNTIWVVDPDTCTRAFVRSWDEFLAQVELRNIINFVAGDKVVDADLHKSGDNDGLWGRLWSNCRDVDEFNDTGSGGGGGGGATKDEVEAIVTADGAKTRAEVDKPRTLQGTVQ